MEEKGRMAKDSRGEKPQTRQEARTGWKTEKGGRERPPPTEMTERTQLKRGRKGEDPGHRAKKEKEETADQRQTNNRRRT